MAIDDNTVYGLTGAQVKELANKVNVAQSTLSEADYNWNFEARNDTTEPFNTIAAWKLPSGWYRTENTQTRIIWTKNDYFNNTYSNTAFLVFHKSTTYTAILRSYGTTPHEALALTGVDATGSAYPGYTASAIVLTSDSLKNNLTTASSVSNSALDARQGKVLKDLVDSLAVRGAGAPTTSTVGTVGQLYEDGTNGALYQLKSIDITVTPNTYNWEQVGGSSVNVVQATGTSTTDVMSQNATTSMVFADPNSRAQVRIGNTGSVSTESVSIGRSASCNASWGVAVGSGAVAAQGQAVSIGYNTRAHGSGHNVAIGDNAIAHRNDSNQNIEYSVSLGAYAYAKRSGEVNIGTGTAKHGYNSTEYRVLGGVHDPVDTHDAATKGYCDNAIINGGTTAPTTATVGAVGTQYTYVDTTSTPTAHLCVCTEIDTTDPSTPVYTWQTLV